MLRLELIVPPQWTRIDQVRQAVGHAIAAAIGDRDLRDALAMVSAELLENAFKYGHPEKPDVRITVATQDDRLVVTVINAVERTAPHARTLAERIAWVNEFDDPLAAYRAALERIFAGGPGASGLGLPRIRYEGGCALECDTSTAGMVTVRAACPLAR